MLEFFNQFCRKNQNGHLSPNIFRNIQLDTQQDDSFDQVNSFHGFYIDMTQINSQCQSPQVISLPHFHQHHLIPTLHS